MRRRLGAELAEGGCRARTSGRGVLSPDGGLLSPDGASSLGTGLSVAGRSRAPVTCVAWAPADADERSPAPPGAFVAGLEDGRVVVVADARGRRGGPAVRRAEGRPRGRRPRAALVGGGGGGRGAGRSGLDPTGASAYDPREPRGGRAGVAVDGAGRPRGVGGRRGVPPRGAQPQERRWGVLVGIPGEAAAFVDVTMRFHDRGTVEAAVARLRDGHHRARGGSRRRPAPGGVRRARVERRVRLRAPTREPRIYPRRWWVEPRGFETAGRVARS